MKKLLKSLKKVLVGFGILCLAVAVPTFFLYLFDNYPLVIVIMLGLVVLAYIIGLCYEIGDMICQK